MKKIILISVLLAAVALANCNVTRTITTSSEAYLWKVCGDAYDQEHPRS